MLEGFGTLAKLLRLPVYKQDRHLIILSTVKHVANLRSQVSRAAIQSCTNLVQKLVRVWNRTATSSPTSCVEAGNEGNLEFPAPSSFDPSNLSSARSALLGSDSQEETEEVFIITTVMQIRK